MDLLQFTQLASITPVGTYLHDQDLSAVMMPVDITYSYTAMAPYPTHLTICPADILVVARLIVCGAGLAGLVTALVPARSVQ